jgi:hypothetical protein
MIIEKAKPKLVDDIKLMKKLEVVFNYTGNFKIPEQYIVMDCCNVCCIELLYTNGSKVRNAGCARYIVIWYASHAGE